MTTRPPLRRLLPAAAVVLAALSGCAGPRVLEAAPGRHFEFSRDSFAYANGLRWEYRVDPATGAISTRKNDPAPEFSQRCFAISRMARQFYRYARFDPAGPEVDDAAYRRAIAAVVERTPEQGDRYGRVPIPGYADLRSFSRAKEPLLKEATGGYLYSIFTFSNWRMVFPFSRAHQAETAQRLLDEVRLNRQPIVHLIHFKPFPLTQIDHVVLVYEAEDSGQEIRFQVYDPNYDERPGTLIYQRHDRTFTFPATKYYNDGPLDVYEIFEDEL